MGSSLSYDDIVFDLCEQLWEAGTLLQYASAAFLVCVYHLVF